MTASHNPGGRVPPGVPDQSFMVLRMVGRNTCSAERSCAPWPELAVSHSSRRNRSRIEGMPSKILKIAFVSWVSRQSNQRPESKRRSSRFRRRSCSLGLV